MLRNIGAPEIIILGVLIILIFGWKRLPDAARSLGRSARVFKSEVQEMRNEDREGDTVRGETVRDDGERRAEHRTDSSGDHRVAEGDGRPHHEASGHERERRHPGDGASGATGTSPIRENTPRTDNQSGPTT